MQSSSFYDKIQILSDDMMTNLPQTQPSEEDKIYQDDTEELNHDSIAEHSRFFINFNTLETTDNDAITILSE